MSKVIVYTCAYNAQRTIGRTMDSILAQTYPDWVYYVVDNGSADKTGAIINEYAAKDPRIVPLANKQNHVWEPGNSYYDVIKDYDNSCFFCWLDADDTYKPFFLEKMLAFMKRHHLDVAACGNDVISASTGMPHSKRQVPQDLILEGKVFDEQFPQYHRFLRTTWGKLYSLSVLWDFWREPDVSSVYYGWDTLFATYAFRKAERAGILSECLHTYYFSPHSVSYVFDERRNHSNRVLFDSAVAFLNAKAGAVSARNEEFLFSVYCNALRDTLVTLIRSDIPLRDKFASLLDIVDCSHTRRLIECPGLANQRHAVFTPLLEWLLSQKEACSGWGIDTIASILAVLGSQAECVPAFHPLLSELDAGSVTFMIAAVLAVIQGDLAAAFDELCALAQNGEIPDEYAQGYITLGLNISAAAENAPGWIFFKKLWIEYLIGQSRLEESAAVLAELEQLLPGDGDLAKLRESIISSKGEPS